MTSFNHISRSCLILNLPLLGRTLIVTNCCSPHSLEQTSPWSPGITQKTDKVHTASSPARFLLCSPPPWPQSLSKAPMRTWADNILCSSPVAGLLSKTGLLLPFVPTGPGYLCSVSPQAPLSEHSTGGADGGDRNPPRGPGSQGPRAAVCSSSAFSIRHR